MAKILVVDDSSITRRNLSTILTEAGHKVIAEAPNGELAFKEYERHMPDLVTMDITMPLLDGIGAVKKIIKHYPDANIIMISALDQKQMVLSAIQCGARHYIIKPFNSDKVLNVVEEVLLFSENAAKHSANVSTKIDDTINEIEATIHELDSTLNKIEDSSISSKVQIKMPSMPFTVLNKTQELHIILAKNIQPGNFSSLEMIVQGFLYINAILVNVDLQDMEHIDDGIINKIADLARLAEVHNAKFKLSAAKPETIAYIKSKNSYLNTVD